MNVERAQHAGACYGVQRALDMTSAALEEYGELCSLGSLIHNPQVVSDFEHRGVKVADDLDDITTETVIIRSHGVAPTTRAALYERGVSVVDATCPYVARAQTAAEELALKCRHVLVVGDVGHPEVESLVACAQEVDADKNGKVDVVGTPDDIPSVLGEPVGIVVQTTQTQENLDAIVEALKVRGIEPLIRNTICSATTRRQKAAVDLATRVDAMVVVGGRNSSNTTRLAQICSRVCDAVYHVETPDELREYAEYLTTCKTVGVTAGASTPEDQIQQVTDYLLSCY